MYEERKKYAINSALALSLRKAEVKRRQSLKESRERTKKNIIKERVFKVRREINTMDCH